MSKVTKIVFVKNGASIKYFFGSDTKLKVFQ